jgi:hypothetical protein
VLQASPRSFLKTYSLSYASRRKKAYILGLIAGTTRAFHGVVE